MIKLRWTSIAKEHLAEACLLPFAASRAQRGPASVLAVAVARHVGLG